MCSDVDDEALALGLVRFSSVLSNVVRMICSVNISNTVVCVQLRSLWNLRDAASEFEDRNQKWPKPVVSEGQQASR